MIFFNHQRPWHINKVLGERESQNTFLIKHFICWIGFPGLFNNFWQVSLQLNSSPSCRLQETSPDSSGWTCCSVICSSFLSSLHLTSVNTNGLSAEDYSFSEQMLPTASPPCVHPWNIPWHNLPRGASGCPPTLPKGVSCTQLDRKSFQG